MFNEHAQCGPPDLRHLPVTSEVADLRQALPGVVRAHVGEWDDRRGGHHVAGWVRTDSGCLIAIDYGTDPVQGRTPPHPCGAHPYHVTTPGLRGAYLDTVDQVIAHVHSATLTSAKG